MIKVRKFVMAGGTFAAAMGIGFLMQSGDAGQAKAAKPQIATAEKQAEMIASEAPLEVSDIILTSALGPVSAEIGEPIVIPTAPIVNAATSQAPELTRPQPEAAPSVGCGIEMSAKPAAAAMVEVTLIAPCLKNERLVLHHNGMMVSQATDAQGILVTLMPALTENATFIASFANGEGAVATTKVTSLEFYDRVVVQSNYAGGISLHALEYGADFDSKGHVSAAQTPGIEAAARGEGGFVQRLGESDVPDALVAEVYTFPTGTAAKPGEIDLSVEAEVSASNCGREVNAQTLQVSAGQRMKVQEITLYMPDCDAVGDFLVLKNLLNDLKIASN